MRTHDEVQEVSRGIEEEAKEMFSQFRYQNPRLKRRRRKLVLLKDLLFSVFFFHFLQEVRYHVFARAALERNGRRQLSVIVHEPSLGP